MKNFIVLFLFHSVLFAKTYDLIELYGMTLHNSETYKIAKLKENHADKEIDKSLSSFYPKIDIDTEYMKINEFSVFDDGVEVEKRDRRRDITVNIEQMLYNRSLYLDYKIKKNDFQKSQLEKIKEHQQIMYDVIKYYLETILKENQLKNAKQKLIRLNAILERAQMKYKSGFISKSDYLEAKAQRDEILAKKIKFESDYKVTRSYLERFSGIDNIELKHNIHLSNFILKSLKEYLLKIEDNLDVKLQQLQLKKSDIQMNKSFSEFEPTLSLNYEYVSNNVPEVDNDRTLTLLFKVNIFDGFYDYKSYQQSRIAKTIESLTFKKLIKEMKQTIKNKIDKINSYFKIVQIYPEILSSKRFSLEGMQERFNLGTKSIIDLLDEEDKYFEQLNIFIEYKYQFLLEYTELHRYVNMLDQNFLYQINGLINE
ncbi:TolC family protein [Halarcobacter anaerophilus]|uniref:TolC family protein n=1 Tax=Halarcobacter anaerophilus TaxID=877500 RepID=UPI0005CB2E9E|nr:TolC family protein [Halarcobacter anaerophilus]